MPSGQTISNFPYDLETDSFRLSYVSARLDDMSFRSTFNLDTQSGALVVNRTVISATRMEAAAVRARAVINAGFGMGRFGSWRYINGGDLEFCTVCGAALDAVLRQSGIPVFSRFGGLLEIVERRPVRFTQIINYNAATLDPLEIFIRGKMTRVYDAAISGNGVIGAAFREIPSFCLPAAKVVISKMERLGLTSVIAIGRPGRPLLDIPVSSGRVGLVLSAGLNVAAAFEENNISSDSRALAGLLDYSTLVPMDMKAEAVTFLRQMAMADTYPKDVLPSVVSRR